MSRILALLALAPLGCAAWGAVSLEGKVWAKANGAYAGPGDYERSEAVCRSGDRRPDVAAGPGPSREFVRCMRGQGWILVDRP
ncbi:MAG: hypothetical protein OEM05_08010 [Myxococcales bacterium]|nr:hypothetical protein [Myxococcales bacterium]